MLVLNLSRIRSEHEQVTMDIAPADLNGTHDDFEVTAPVHLAFEIHKDKARFRVVGRVATTLALPCSRCLEPFVWPVAADFDLRYHPRGSAEAEAGDQAIGDDDMGVAFYDNDELDLRQLLEEQFYLSLPMKPLCGDQCRGLCPVCGINLNRDTCACTTTWNDPRLAALKDLTKES